MRLTPGRYRAVNFLVALLVAVVGALAAYNVLQSERFLADTAASQSIARARRALDRLANGTAGAATLRGAVAAIDAEVGPMASGAARGADGSLWSDAYPGDADTARQLSAVDHAWREYRVRLDPVVEAGAPVQDVAAAIAGSVTAGLDLERTLESLSRSVATEARERAGTFRKVQLAGLAAAVLVLCMLIFHVLRNLRSEDAELSSARAETERILDTVGEGLLLLDRHNTIAAQTSRALRRMLRREDVAGLSFDALLAELVPEKTRRTALDYVSLLWGERVNENLVRSLNPLAETEVRIPSDGGDPETRYFAFDFSRVRSGARTTSSRMGKLFGRMVALAVAKRTFWAI
jgi:hypothetical protein